MRPGDQVSVRARGQGFRPGWLPADVAMMSLDPDVLAGLPIGLADERRARRRGQGRAARQAGW